MTEIEKIFKEILKTHIKPFYDCLHGVTCYHIHEEEFPFNKIATALSDKVVEKEDVMEKLDKIIKDWHGSGYLRVIQWKKELEGEK